VRRATFLVTLAFALSATATTSEPGLSLAGDGSFAPVLHPMQAEPTPIALRSTSLAQRVVPRGTFAARAREDRLLVWTAPRPGARIESWIGARNDFGQPLSFLVVDAKRDAAGTGWVRIETGTEPNGARAWVRAEHVRLVPMRERIVVDLSKRELRRFVNGKLRDRLTVAVGSPSTPTVPGTYFVWARVRDYKPSIYGRFVLGLSGFSEVVRFGPTPGRLAIHGTSDPSDKGRAVSLGCVRVLNQELQALWGVPMGTPVTIKP
jgi:lipoprotein-anchoring transpeptidase ErfK/SrfK